MAKIQITRGDVNMMVNEAVRRLLREFDPNETSWANMPSGWEDYGPSYVSWECEAKIHNIKEALACYASSKAPEMVSYVDTLIGMMNEKGVLTDDTVEFDVTYEKGGESITDVNAKIDERINSCIEEIYDDEAGEMFYELELFFSYLTSAVEEEFENFESTGEADGADIMSSYLQR